MPLSKLDVQRWLNTAAPKVGLTRVALDARLPRLRLVQQLASGHVAEETVVAVARSRGIAPLKALASFEQYRDLAPGRPAPSEALTLLGAPALLRAAADRAEGNLISEADLGPLNFGESSRLWFSNRDDGSLRERIQDDLGLGRSGLWRMLNTTIRPDVAAFVARAQGSSVSSALVIARVLEPGEAGWSEDERAQAIRSLPLSDLFALVERRAHDCALKLKQNEDFSEFLG